MKHSSGALLHLLSPGGCSTAEAMEHRFWLGAAGIAVFVIVVSAATCAGEGQGHQGLPDRRQDRGARGLRQADRERLHAGPGVPDQGHHEGRRRQDRGDGQGRPAQARPRQDPAGGMLQRRQGRPRRRHHGVARRARHAAGRRGEQEGADRRAGGGRLDHRRQVEPLHLPHRRAAPTRTRWPARPPFPKSGEVSVGMLGLDTAFGRDGVAAFKQALAELRPNVKVVAEEYAAGNTADFAALRRAPVQRAQGQAGQEGDRLHLGGAASDGQVRRHEARALRHRAGARRQHPARDERAGSSSPAPRAASTTTTTSRRTR